MSTADSTTAPELHPIFRNAPPDDAPVWRYMSFAKFAAMLREGGILHLARLDQFSDHLEGKWTKRDVEEWNKRGGFPVAFTEGRRSKTAATCWFALPQESNTMWKSYAPGPEGVAIRTTFGKLRDVVKKFASAAPQTLAGAAYVAYVDHYTDSLIADLKPDDFLPNTLVPYMMKDKGYIDEREVRGLVVAPDDQEVEETGLGIGFDAATFFEEIVVSPGSQEWFENLVRAHARQFGVTNVRRSRFDPRPT